MCLRKMATSYPCSTSPVSNALVAGIAPHPPAQRSNSGRHGCRPHFSDSSSRLTSESRPNEARTSVAAPISTARALSTPTSWGEARGRPVGRSHGRNWLRAGLGSACQAGHWKAERASAIRRSPSASRPYFTVLDSCRVKAPGATGACGNQSRPRRLVTDSDPQPCSSCNQSCGPAGCTCRTTAAGIQERRRQCGGRPASDSGAGNGR
jgi:hypothetical protein